MSVESLNLQVVVILTLGFTLATILGYITHKIKLSPILGYLLAGYLIGPFSPGYVANLKLAEQLAEVGVLLMMFGVGLHFKWQDLLKVKNIAIPGALAQVFVTSIVAAMTMHFLGGSWALGVIMGLAVGVASTVVLVRILSDQNLLYTLQGQIAVGWLIVEDILTVAVLILLPTIVTFLAGGSVSLLSVITSISFILLKFFLLAVTMFTLGRKMAAYVLFKIARLRSPELFILSVLSLIFLMATSSALIFGTSLALGAFLAGMVIGQTDVRHQASAYASPMKDAFVVIFFLSVGMLFNPKAILEHTTLFFSVLGIILIIKPLVAFLITIFSRYNLIVALTIAIALAQIGEFSFILAEEASKFGLFSDEGYDIIVACALISIVVNPLLFKLFDLIKPYCEELPNTLVVKQRVKESSRTRAIVVGFGVVGKAAVETLEKKGFHPIIIDYNVDTIVRLIEEKREAIYGEASLPHLLAMAHLELADFLVITIPDLEATLKIIQYVRDTHPDITIIARARYVSDRHILNQMGVRLIICCEEEEVSHAFERIVSQIESDKERKNKLNNLDSPMPA